MNYFRVDITFINYEGKNTLVRKGNKAESIDLESAKDSLVQELTEIAIVSNLNNPLDNSTTDVIDMTEDEYLLMFPLIIYDEQVDLPTTEEPPV
jgi:hypothetical protein